MVTLLSRRRRFRFFPYERSHHNMIVFSDFHLAIFILICVLERYFFGRTLGSALGTTLGTALGTALGSALGSASRPAQPRIFSSGCSGTHYMIWLENIHTPPITLLSCSQTPPPYSGKHPPPYSNFQTFPSMP